MPRRTHTDTIRPASEPPAIVAETAIEADGIETSTAAEHEPIPEAARPTSSPEAPSGKLGSIHGLIAGPAGATIDDLVALTGWQPHTIRAALSRLRRRGFPIALVTDPDGRKAYRLEVREG